MTAIGVLSSYLTQASGPGMSGNTYIANVNCLLAGFSLVHTTGLVVRFLLEAVQQGIHRSRHHVHRQSGRRHLS